MNLLEIAESIGVTGFLHCNELQKLVELAAGRDVLEIGSYRGLSAWGMAISAKSVTCVDTFQAATDGQRQTGEMTTLSVFMEATRRYTNVRSVIGRSSEVQVDGLFDMLFIDAMHDYESVKADIQRWWQFLRNGGIFAAHDYHHHDWPGVAQALDEMFGPAKDSEVEITLRWLTKGLMG